MAPVLPSLPLTAPAARSQLLTSARNTSKARGHAATVRSLDTATVQHHLGTWTQTFTVHQPSDAKDNIRYSIPPILKVE